MDQRQDTLAQWAADQIEQLYQHSIPAQMVTVSGDASFRRYFRINHNEKGTQKQWIAVDAPPEHENSRQFVDIASVWSLAGVKVPTVLAFDEAQGFMLLEDFGDVLLHPELTPDAADGLYQSSIDSLIELQQLPQTTNIPDYDRELLDREMALFTDWLCEKHLGLKLSTDEKTMLKQAFDTLADSALAQRQVMVHRDYHSRNLMVCTANAPLHDKDFIGIIDFQDAVYGALTYDLVSLLKDCYIQWPREKVLAWLGYFKAQSPLAANMTEEQLVRDFDLMGLQRHLKAAGIFARLSLRDGKHGYLKDVPRTCEYIVQATALYPEFSDFNAWLNSVFLPALNETQAS
ncbi:MAG: aminoglycoside/choline kinase family phosphotransferase [Oleispira sp.]|jgi:aminoglycoside/choline kinase family phosphotransferase|tara:strand:+ start:119 stop:1156 length:1038 start_codon:yes stop_codon:yes gene_type:complete